MAELPRGPLGHVPHALSGMTVRAIGEPVFRNNTHNVAYVRLQTESRSRHGIDACATSLRSSTYAAYAISDESDVAIINVMTSDIGIAMFPSSCRRQMTNRTPLWGSLCSERSDAALKAWMLGAKNTRHAHLLGSVNQELKHTYEISHRQQCLRHDILVSENMPLTGATATAILTDNQTCWSSSKAGVRRTPYTSQRSDARVIHKGGHAVCGN